MTFLRKSCQVDWHDICMNYVCADVHNSYLVSDCLSRLKVSMFSSFHKTNPQTVPCTCGFTIYSHIISLCVQPKIQQIMVRGFCRPLDWASTSCPLLTKSLVQVLSDYVGTPEAFGVLRPDQ